MIEPTKKEQEDLTGHMVHMLDADGNSVYCTLQRYDDGYPRHIYETLREGKPWSGDGAARRIPQDYAETIIDNKASALLSIKDVYLSAKATGTYVPMCDEILSMIDVVLGLADE